MKSTKKIIGLLKAAVAAVLIGLTASNAPATELVYVPVNPSFGGNPLNAPGLLGAAQATNKHKAPVTVDSALSRQTSLQQFNDMLERSILSQLAYAATSSVMGTGGRLVPGTVETGNFRINILDMGGGVLQITTTDKVTGASTSFQVGQ
ncbi:curli assembly protein CsgF [Herbaspirillum sp. ST 5-3]|uniref:curli assembly protein CsgF n=1 Tax=Oxalobacteraceae TaxID=75682 RepID=UPI0010A3E9EB|nr:curli assembly protein CsgF [Herbaspirillum sp. ST 5-3]